MEIAPFDFYQFFWYEEKGGTSSQKLLHSEPTLSPNDNNIHGSYP